MDALLAVFLLAITYVTGRRAEARHFKSLSAREKNLAHILIIPSEDVAYTLPVQRSSFVSAGLSLSADYFRNALAGFVSLFGGRLHVLESVSNRARRELLVRLKEQCGGALCITGVRVEVMKEKRGLVEAFAYGTALYAPGISTPAYGLMPQAQAPEPDRPTAPRHPLKELAVFGGGALALLLAAYVALGALVSYYAPLVTPEQENWLWQLAADKAELLDGARHSPDLRAEQERMQALLDALPKDEALAGYRFRVHINEGAEVNAVALPGGNIVVYKGLLDAVPSENARAFVLGHELGHYAHRDHIRQMGRGLVASMITASLFGYDSVPTRFVSDIMIGVDNRFSRAQETAADEYGLDMVAKHYGHAGGAAEFFDALMREGNESALASYFSTHPMSAERAAHLKRLIAARGLETKPAAPQPEAAAAEPPPAPLPAFDRMSYEQLTSASKSMQREYDEIFRHFQNIYARGALDKPDFIARELANAGRAESLRAQHYAHALEVLKRTRLNIADMAAAMKAPRELAARHTGRIDRLLELTADLAAAEQAQLAQHKTILRFLETRQGAYTLSGNNAIRFGAEADNEAFNQLNKQLLEAETKRNAIAEEINALADAAP